VRVARENRAVDEISYPEGEKRLIDEAELVKLQKRMLAILEDLCSD